MATKAIEKGSLVTATLRGETSEYVVERADELMVVAHFTDRPGYTTFPPECIKKVGPVVKDLSMFEGRQQPKVSDVAPKTEKAAAPKVRAARSKGGETTFQKAVTLARANPTATRQELIKMLIDELGMTPAGASTYASTARKAASST